MPQRYFLGWDQPFLQAAATHMLAAHTKDTLADLGEMMVFVPGRRAGRRLLDYLVAEAEQQGVGMVPPTILPAGELIHTFAPPPTRELAGTLQRGLAWMRALQATSHPALDLLFSPQQVSEIQRGRLIWPLATVLDQLQTTVAAGGFDFAAVHACLQDDSMVPELHHARWLALAEVQQHYFDVLGEAGLQDPEQHKIQSVDRGFLLPEAPVYLVGLIDMSPLLARAARQLAGRLQVLLYAPPSLSEAFDDLGRADRAYWSGRTLSLDETELVQVAGARDQARYAVELLAASGIDQSPASATLVCPDPALVPELDLAVATKLPDIALHDPQRRRLQFAPPMQLLQGVGEYLRDGDFAALTALLRHPDLAAVLEEPGVTEHGDLPALLDACHAEHLGSMGPEGMLQDAALKSEARASLRAALHALEALLQPARDVRDFQSGAAWLESLLARVYNRDFAEHVPDDHPYVRAFEALQQFLTELSATSSLWSQTDPVGVVDLLRAWVGDAFMPDEPAAHEVDVVGFLEAYLDDAPLVVVTSLSEGLVPEHFGADAFLPGTLRARLGLPDNQARYVRDACIVETLCRDHSRRAVFLSARKGPDGSPMMLSRLALSGNDPERIARRLLRHSDAPVWPSDGAPAGTVSEMVARLDVTQSPPEKMSVTSFKTYLENPWYFYLRYVLGLKTAEDNARELDGRLFGNVAHNVLDFFGRSHAAGEADPQQVQTALADFLADEAGRRFGPRPRPVIALQLRRLQMRLDRFAQWQAWQVREGWSILDCEVRINPDKVALPLLDGGRMPLSGRIDRIDRHADGRYRIIDYKTSETAKKPLETHLNAEHHWIDLQLPLYDFAWRQAHPDAVIELGYVALCKDLDKITFLEARGLPGRGNQDVAWELDDALACAVEVAERVRRREFPDLREQHPSGQYAEFAALRGQRVSA